MPTSQVSDGNVDVGINGGIERHEHLKCSFREVVPVFQQVLGFSVTSVHTRIVSRVDDIEVDEKVAGCA